MTFNGSIWHETLASSKEELIQELWREPGKRQRLEKEAERMVRYLRIPESHDRNQNDRMDGFWWVSSRIPHGQIQVRYQYQLPLYRDARLHYTSQSLFSHVVDHTNDWACLAWIAAWICLTRKIADFLLFKYFQAQNNDSLSSHGRCPKCNDREIPAPYCCYKWKKNRLCLPRNRR